MGIHVIEEFKPLMKFPVSEKLYVNESKETVEKIEGGMIFVSSKLKPAMDESQEYKIDIINSKGDEEGTFILGTRMDFHGKKYIIGARLQGFKTDQGDQLVLDMTDEQILTFSLVKKNKIWKARSFSKDHSFSKKRVYCILNTLQENDLSDASLVIKELYKEYSTF